MTVVEMCCWNWPLVNELFFVWYVCIKNIVSLCCLMSMFKKYPSIGLGGVLVV